jgi:hypothetical protein
MKGKLCVSLFPPSFDSRKGSQTFSRRESSLSLSRCPSQTCERNLLKWKANCVSLSFLQALILGRILRLSPEARALSLSLSLSLTLCDKQPLSVSLYDKHSFGVSVLQTILRFESCARKLESLLPWLHRLRSIGGASFHDAAATDTTRIMRTVQATRRFQIT